MDKNTLAIALVSTLLGGFAVAAYQSLDDDVQGPGRAPRAADAAMGATVRSDRLAAEASLAPQPVEPQPVDTSAPAVVPSVAARAPAPIPAAATPRPRLAYADVVNVDPVHRKAARYATVIGTDPVRETTTTTVPREVCEDVVVQERMPERDGNVGGTVAGAVIGGLLGSRVGDGDGRRAATAAAAVAGGFIGNRIDRRHVGGRPVERIDRQCRTVSETSQQSKVVAYNVTFRNADGTVGTMRMDSRPGSRVRLGSSSEVVGYDVTYRLDGRQRTLRMAERPGSRLPVVGGRVAVPGAVASRG